jgi:hypothetical protein
MADLPVLSPEAQEALWLARAPRRIPPEDLAEWLSALCPDDGDALRARPVSTGQPFVL